VIRFTTRFTMYNQLSQTIVVKQEGPRERGCETILAAGNVCELDISLLETCKKQLQIRVATEQEKAELGDKTHMQLKNKKSLKVA